MHQALILIIGFMGPLCLVGLIGIIYGFYTNSKNNTEHSGQVASSI